MNVRPGFFLESIGDAYGVTEIKIKHRYIHLGAKTGPEIVKMKVCFFGFKRNLQFGNLERTNGKHAVLSILSAFSLLLHFYFVRLDIEFEGAVITLQMESVFLALTGFFSIWSWHVSIKGNLVTPTLSMEEKKGVYLKLLPEPIVSLLTLPFAVYDPDIWTLAWLLLIPLTIIINRLGKSNKLPVIKTSIANSNSDLINPGLIIGKLSVGNRGPLFHPSTFF